MLKRFVALLMVVSALLTFSGLAFAQFLEENYLSIRGVTFNLPSGFLLTISGEVLIASSFESLQAYNRRDLVEEGIVISIAFPSELEDIGLTADTPPLEAAETFASLVGGDVEIVEYDTSYGPFESREAYSFPALGDSIVIFVDLGGATVAFRVAGEYELYSSNVNGIITSMELDDVEAEEEANAFPFLNRTALAAFAGAQ